MVTKHTSSLSEEFWNTIFPLIPCADRSGERQYTRKPGAGRKPLSQRLVLEAILYVLRTGCPWKALPKERYGSPSSVHRYYRAWLRQGFFQAVWNAGLAESDEMEGIAWKWSVLPHRAEAEVSRPVGKRGRAARHVRMWMPCKEMRRGKTNAGRPDPLCDVL
ncbi:hypothetical protein JCM15519_02150 [Fundidesulfovibrio butyratiphilus]